jgi:hypothetical protein
LPTLAHYLSVPLSTSISRNTCLDPLCRAVDHVCRVGQGWDIPISVTRDPLISSTIHSARGRRRHLETARPYSTELISRRVPAWSRWPARRPAPSSMAARHPRKGPALFASESVSTPKACRHPPRRRPHPGRTRHTNGGRPVRDQPRRESLRHAASTFNQLPHRRCCGPARRWSPSTAAATLRRFGSPWATSSKATSQCG